MLTLVLCACSSVRSVTYPDGRREESRKQFGWKEETARKPDGTEITTAGPDTQGIVTVSALTASALLGSVIPISTASLSNGLSKAIGDVGSLFTAPVKAVDNLTTSTR